MLLFGGRWLESKLRENEAIVKELEEGWHAIRHGEKVEWFRTAYRSGFFRQPVLTNQRLVFLKDGEIDYEVSLENVVEAKYKSYLMNPYFALQLKDGSIISVVLECIAERVWLGSSMEGAQAARESKEWVKEINLQIKGLSARKAGEGTLFPYRHRRKDLCESVLLAVNR